MATKFITVSIEIMHDKNLNQSQKFMLAEIEQLCSLDSGCFASNNHFAELIGITKENVSRNLNDLKEMGYIDIQIENGSRNHTRIVTLTNLVIPPYQNSKTPLLKQQETKDNIQTNKTINTYASLISEFSRAYGTPNDRALETINKFIAYRKTIRKPVKTIKAIKLYLDSLKVCLEDGYSLHDLIELMENKEWQSIKLEWVKKELGDNKPKEWTVG